MKPINLFDRAYLGMGLSRYTGFEFMQCVDVDDFGVIKLNIKPIAEAVKSGQSFGSVPFQLGYGRTSASAFLRFAIGSGFLKYFNTTNSEWTDVGTPGTTTYDFGMGFFAGSNAKDFLIYPASTAGQLNALDCASIASPSVTANFITTLDSGALYRPFHSGSNNRLYIGNKNKVAELYENSGQTFAPGTAGTFTCTPDKLKLGSSYEVSCFDEWNEYLVIGTKNPANNIMSDIFLWDMVSPGYDRRISVNVPGGINQIIVHKNYIYFQAGNFGEWFVSAGGGVEKIAQIPKHLLGVSGYIAKIYPMARVAKGDRIYFGCSIGSGEKSLSGVWSFDTRIIGETFDPTNRGVQACQYEHTMSTGQNGATAYLGGFLPISNEKGFDYGFASTVGETTTAGVDTIGKTSNSLYDASEGQIISRFIEISPFDAKSFKTRLVLAKPLLSGQSIVILYRSNPSYDTNTATAWVTATAYSLANEVIVNGVQYYCIEAHTSAAASEPGVGANWKTYWAESWHTYYTANTLGEFIFDCGAISASNARFLQFKYIIDIGASQDKSPEILSHYIYD